MMHQSSLAKILFGALMVSAAPSNIGLRQCMQAYNASQGAVNGTRDEMNGGRGDKAFWSYVHNGYDAIRPDGKPEHNATQVTTTHLAGVDMASFKNTKLGDDEKSVDQLTIPDIWFPNINDAHYLLNHTTECGEEGLAFINLIAGVLQAGSSQCAKNSNCTAAANNTMKACFHLKTHTSVNWMHLHVYTDDKWQVADALWTADNTCVQIDCKGDPHSPCHENFSLNDDDAVVYAKQIETCMWEHWWNPVNYSKNFETCFKKPLFPPKALII